MSKLENHNPAERFERFIEVFGKMSRGEVRSNKSIMEIVEEEMGAVGKDKQKVETDPWNGYGIWFGIVVEEGKQKVTYLYKPDFDPTLLADAKQREKLKTLKTTYSYLKSGNKESQALKLLGILENQTDMALILRFGFNHDQQAEQTSYDSAIHFREVWWGEHTQSLRITPEPDTPPLLENVTYADITLKQGVRYYDKRDGKYIGGNSAAVIEMAHAIGHFWEIYNLKGFMAKNTLHNISVKLEGSPHYIIPFIEVEIEKVRYRVISEEYFGDKHELNNALKQNLLFSIHTDNYFDTPVFNKDMFLTEYINLNFNGGKMTEWIAMIVQNLFADSLGESPCPMISPNEKPINKFNYDPQTAKYKSKYPLYNVLPSAEYRYRYRCERMPTPYPTIIPK